MQLQTAERQKVKLRLNIASPSGFGKSYSALLIAYGICSNWENIAVLDTENGSASLYAHLGKFKTIRLDPPFTSDRYIQAIKICEQAGIEVIIIDSITHVWKGQGGLLEYQSSLGGRYQDWAKATPLYQNWLNTILQSQCHVITTNRKKQGYNMITDGNKTRVEKAGLDDEIRDGYEYEMTIALEIINDKHLTKASKDRTGLFTDKPEFVITTETGKKIIDWCNSGTPNSDKPQKKVDLSEQLLARIESCKSVSELIKLYQDYPQYQEPLLSHFTTKKLFLESKSVIQPQNFSKNGTSVNTTNHRSR